MSTNRKAELALLDSLDDACENGESTKQLRFELRALLSRVECRRLFASGGSGPRICVRAKGHTYGGCTDLGWLARELDQEVIEAVAALAEWHTHPINNCPACLDDQYRQKAVALLAKENHE